VHYGGSVHELTAEDFRAAPPQKGKKMYSISFQTALKFLTRAWVSALSSRSQNSIKVYLQIRVANLMSNLIISLARGCFQLSEWLSNLDSAWS